MIYLVILLIILLFTFKYELRTISPSRLSVLFVLFIFIIVAGFRYRVGTDTLVYMDDYNNRFYIIKDKYLIGWSFFMGVCKRLHFSFYMIQIIVAIIINCGVIRFLKRYFADYLFSGILLYYVILYVGWNFEVMRQAICVSLFLFSLPYLEQRKYLYYYLIIAIACTIHETALLLLVVPFFMRISISKRLLLVFSVLFVVLAAFAPYIRNAVVGYALILAPFQDKASMYFKNVDLDGSYNLFIYILNIILNVGIPLFVVWRNCKSKQINSTLVGLAVLSFFTYALSLMLPMMYRINYYFILPNLLLFIYLFVDIAKKTNKKRLVYFSLLFLFLAFKARTYFVTDDDGIPAYVHYYPYYSILNEQTVPERESIDLIYY